MMDVDYHYKVGDFAGMVAAATRRLQSVDPGLGIRVTIIVA